MILLVMGMVMLFFCLPAILGFLAALAISAFIFGPIIVLGLIGFAFYAHAVTKVPKKPRPIKYINKPKPRLINYGGNKVPVGVFIYSIISAVIIAPILILAFILFCPSIIAIPLIFITIGVEIGRLCGSKHNRKPGIQNYTKPLFQQKPA